MDRDHWLCQPCQREGKATPANECDHITPKSKGGSDDPDNLQAICTECHKAKTTREAAEAQGRSVKAIRQVGLDGYPISKQDN